MNGRVWAFLGFLAAACGPAAALTTNTGENSAQFLQLGAGARSLGMGEAYGTVAEGAEAIYWNPAGLAAMERPETTYSHAEFMRFFHHEFAAYAHPVKPLAGTLAVSLTMFHQDSIPVVTNANETIGEFTPHGEAFALAYAHDFSSRDPEKSDRDYFREAWSLPGNYRPLRFEREPWEGGIMAGLAVKVVSETYYKRQSAAVAFDGGVIYRLPDIEDLKFSFVFRNVGSEQRFVNESQSLPVELDMGLAYDQRFKKARLLPAFEVSLPYYGDPYGKIGLEYVTFSQLGNSAAFRVGYKTLSATGLSPVSGITAGIGGGFKWFRLDFGFQPMAELGEVYRMTVSRKW